MKINKVFTDGRRVVGYEVENGDKGTKLVDANLMAVISARGQFGDVKSQVHAGKVLHRYKDRSAIEVVSLSKTVEVSERKSVHADAEFKLVAIIKDGKRVEGYKVEKISNGEVSRVGKVELVEMARSNNVANARVQMYNGKQLLRGYKCNLKELPVERIDEPKENEGIPSIFKDIKGVTPEVSEDISGVGSEFKDASESTTELYKNVVAPSGIKVRYSGQCNKDGASILNNLVHIKIGRREFLCSKCMESNSFSVDSNRKAICNKCKATYEWSEPSMFDKLDRSTKSKNESVTGVKEEVKEEVKEKSRKYKYAGPVMKDGRKVAYRIENREPERERKSVGWSSTG